MSSFHPGYLPSPLFSHPRSAGECGRVSDTPVPSLSFLWIATGGPRKKNSARKSETHFEKGVPCIEIRTKKSETILVSAEDVGLVLGHTWRVNKDGYAQAMIGGKPVVMHRLIAGTPKGAETDHRDMNKLNNCRENLRIATHGQNAANRMKLSRSKNTFKGVRWSKKKNRWQAWCTKNLVEYGGRSFRTEEAAARAYDELAKNYHGEFARLNFPNS